MLLKSLLLFLLFQFCTCRDTIRWNEQQLKDVDGEVLVSKESNFELGFFSPGDSSHRYVAIWYSQSKISAKTVVWIANRDSPINDTSGVLKMNRYGELALYAYNMENIPIWSSNVSQLVQNTNTLYRYVQLLDTGNLVLFRDGKNGSLILWQSFDYPTDTLIPGMKFGLNWKKGLDWVLTSWKSPDDPGKGDYAFRVDPNHNATPQYFVYKGFTKYWRMDAGPWPNFVSNANEMYINLPYKSNAISIVRMKDSGLFQHLTWNDADHQWVEMWSSPKYPCDWYGHCGANSRCRPDNINLFECECIPGYEPKSVDGWNRRDGTDGCVSKRVRVSKCRNGEGFVKVARVKDPDTSNVARLRTSMSAKECEQECLKNCSCTAYMSITLERVVNCLTWYDDLMDMLVYTGVGRDLYVRVDKISLAEARNSQGFFRSGKVLIPILTSLVALLLIIILSLWLLKEKRKTRDYLDAEELEESKRHPELQFFDLNTLIAATDNFSDANKLGQGGFGSVYKGELPNEQKVAVKRLSRTSGQGIEEFKNEVALIARLQHRNLVKLLGCCIKGEERILVLEYMPNKSLDSFLFDNTRTSLLNWEKRFEIINGVARAVLYLHRDSRLRVIHRDLKTSNVLLDADLDPKISDFGMARIFQGDQLLEKTNRVVGTYGYMSPEYAVFGRFSTKSDVFSFGIILLEIVSGKRNNCSYEMHYSINLIGHVWQLWVEDKVLEIVDSSLEIYQLDEVLRCIQVGLLCVQEDSKDRPAMSAVVFMLSGETSLPSPKQPAFVFRTSSSIVDDPFIPNESYSSNSLTITNMEAR
ncbi:G-type lectin S-receptor-like serine/threonine-protein kinase RKS1 [Rosa sericea]